MSARRCAVVGASGLVGGHLVRQLVEDPAYATVRALVRRPLGLRAATLAEAVVDFDHLEQAGDALAVDDVFCCLGTTIKKAGSQEAFRQVDFTYPLAVARAAAAAGAGAFVVVTAVGANAKSGIFYNRVKGELEVALREVAAAALPRGLHIMHPSLLLGERGESRPGEAIGVAVMRATRGLFFGGLTRYKAIDAAQVAQAMRHAAARADGGVHVYEGQALFAL